jgi:hypothetical protein
MSAVTPAAPATTTPRLVMESAAHVQAPRRLRFPNRPKLATIPALGRASAVICTIPAAPERTSPFPSASLVVW